jgi:hypothetical protein
MQERQIVTHFLVPADQHAAETVHPTMRALYYPSPRFVPCLLFDGVSLFPRARMWAVNPNSASRSRTASKSSPLSRHITCGCLGVGAGRSTGILAMVARAILKSWRFAPSTARPTGTPPLSVRTLRLVPIFPRSVGFWPTCFPSPKWRLGHRPIHGEPCPVNPL